MMSSNTTSNIVEDETMTGEILFKTIFRIKMFVF
jgi:hypothetical protein